MAVIEVWYLAHSGFALETSDRLLIFDYYLDSPDPEAGNKRGNNSGDDKKARSLATGVVSPDEIRNKKVIVFSSHRHPDHFNPVILSWKKELENSDFFLSTDIPKKYHRDWTHLLKPHQTYENDILKIQTFQSTDEGVAFLIDIGGISIYHAGDLNWWHWHGEPSAWNKDMEARFKREVAQIGNSSIDVAFLAADPRQEDAALWGMTYFLDRVNVKIAFPMHFWNDYSIMDSIRSEAKIHPELNKVKCISGRGQHFTLTV